VEIIAIKICFIFYKKLIDFVERKCYISLAVAKRYMLHSKKQMPIYYINWYNERSSIYYINLRSTICLANPDRWHSRAIDLLHKSMAYDNLITC